MDEILTILKTMDVPEQRVTDLHWLYRNLGFRNSQHSQFNHVMKLIRAEIRKQS